MDENEKKNNFNVNPNPNFDDSNENQENPYYNPYFQNTDLSSSSPYFSDNNVNLNNNIYDDANNNLNSNIQDDTNNFQDNTNQNIPNTEEVNNSNIQDNSSLNLFDLASDDNSDIPQSQNVQNGNDNSTNPLSNLFEINQDDSNDTYTTNNIISNDYMENDNTYQQNNSENYYDTMQQSDTENYYNTMQQGNTENYYDTMQQSNTENYYDSVQQSNYSPRPINPILNNSSVNNDASFYQEENINESSQNFQPQAQSQQDFNNSNSFNNNFNDSFNNGANQYGSENDEDFRRIWMGNLYEKANTQKFNWAAFFFNGFYLFYRKLYLWGLLFILFSIIPLVNNIVCGFVFYPLYKSYINKQLAKYKNTVQSPNQLLDIAKKKGGTSVLAAILSVLAFFIIPFIIIIVGFSSIILSVLGLSGLMNNPSNPYVDGNTINNNSIYQEPTTQYEYYTFYNDYDIKYDASTWMQDSDGKALTNGNYKLSFMQAIENLSSVGYDISNNSGRSIFFTFLYNQFSSQIDANTTLELGSSNFSALNTEIYYSYIDLIYSTSIERCYFILIPEDDIFIEFILSNQDTVISDSIHTEIIDYISSIAKASERTTNENQDSNQNSNNESTDNSENVLDLIY